MRAWPLVVSVVVGSLAVGGPLLVGCGGSDPELATNGGGGVSGSKAYSVGLGGDAGAAGESGQAGAGAASGQGDGGSTGEVGGFAGQGASAGSSAGGKGGASLCTDALEPLAACADDAKGACASCVCASEACAQRWTDCAASDGCARAVSCLTHGCSADLCAEQAGKGQMKLVALLGCLGGDCGSVCGQTSAGAGGTSGKAGSGGSAGKSTGGASGQSTAGQPGGGHAGQTSAGSGGQSGAEAQGGAAGTGGLSEQGGAGGQGGAAGSEQGGAAGSEQGGAAAAGEGGAAAAGEGGAANSGGQSGGTSQLACKVPTASPSLGTCTETMGNSACNPITGAPCKVDAGEVCGGIWADGMLAGFGCEMPVTLGGVCEVCGAGVACEAGLLCSVGTGQCGKLCCDSGDCGQGNHCSPLSGSEGVGLCMAGAP